MTLGLLALMPVGVETRRLVAANVVAVLGLGVPDGAANLCVDVLATPGVIDLAVLVFVPVAGLPVLGHVVGAAVLGPVLGILVLGPVDGVPLLGPDVEGGVPALGPAAGAPLPVPAGENVYLDPVITELDVVVLWT